MMRRAALAVAMAALAAAGCTSDPHAWAGVVQSRAQLIGGPRALGDLGDYRLHNGKVRFIVQNVGASRGFGTFGGSLIDADLQRPDDADPYANGTSGRDGLAELFPAFFLMALDPTDIKVLDDGSGDGKACGMPAGASCIRLTGKSSEFLTATTFIDQATLGSGLDFSVDYKLGPSDDFLTITASITNSKQFAHSFPIAAFPIPFGFIALFGDGQPLFLDGEAGYDVRFSLERSYKRPYALPAFPGVTADSVATEADGVSYALSYVPNDGGGYAYRHRDQYGKYGDVNPWTMLVPFVSSSFVGVYMAEAPAALSPGDSFSYTAKLRVSDGSAASAIGGVYRDNKVATGLFGGVLREEVSELPVASGDVVVFKNEPGLDGSRFGRAVSTLRSDASGRYVASLPPGDYVAVARKVPRPNGDPTFFRISVGQPTYADVHVGRPATLAVEVHDETGQLVPAKVTVDAPYEIEHANQDPKTFLYDLRLGDPYRPTDLIPDTDDPETRRYVEGIFRAVGGRAQGQVRPGDYRVTVSRGPAYSLDVQQVHLEAGTETAIGATVRRLLPANNRVAADLHVHSIASIDADVPFDDRLASYAAEGVDFLANTDHNYVVDMKPVLARTGLQDFVQTTSGIELTSLEAGHWNAYPLNFPVGPIRHYDLDWFQKLPQDLFDGLRSMGAYGPSETVVQVNHPRDPVQGYFTAYNLIGDALDNDLAHDTPPRGGTFIPQGPGFQFGDFSLDFDAVEILTGKRYDLMTTYRVPDPPPPAPTPPPCTGASTAGCMGPPGSIVRDATGAVAFPGAIDDWQHLLDAGHRVTAVGNSDSHHLLDEAGYPRNLIDVGHAWAGAAAIDDREIARALKAGKSQMTTAPEITLTAIDPATGAEIPVGGLVKPDASGVVKVHVIIDAAPWVEVNRAQLLLPNGEVSVLALGDPAAGGVRRLDTTVRVRVPDGRDSWIAAMCTGDKSLYPVVVPFEIPPLLLSDAVDAVGGAIGLKDTFGNLKPSLITRMTPIAVTNPVLVDGNGDGSWGLPRSARVGRKLGAAAVQKRPRSLSALYRDWVAH